MKTWENSIIRIKGIEGLAGLGIVMEVTESHGIKDEKEVLLVVTGDVDESFGVIEVKVGDAIRLDNEQIAEALVELKEKQSEFPYFTIQLNDMQFGEALKVEETADVKEKRESVEE